MYSSANKFYPLNQTNQITIDTHQNPSSRDQQPPCSSSSSSSSLFLNFPQPFLDDGDLLLSELLTYHNNHQQILQPNGINSAVETRNHGDQINPEVSTKGRSNTRVSSKQQTSRNRTGKKDRHSKIYTAQGPRDRRMRLSLQIARKFFDLQDMLGFDKASKTIDWLFTKSKAAIKELTDGISKVNGSSESRSVSSTSESEVLSGIKLTTDYNGDKRELREKARERARERTKKKLQNEGLNKSNPKDLVELKLPSSLENGEKQAMRSIAKLHGDVEAGTEEEGQNCQHHMNSMDIVDKFLELSSESKSSSTSIFDLSQNFASPSGYALDDHVFTGFHESWSLINGRSFSLKISATGTTNNNDNDNVLVPNQNGFFLTPLSNDQDQNPSSAFMDYSNSDKQNPTFVPVTTVEAGLYSQFTSGLSCNSIDSACKYGGLY